MKKLILFVCFVFFLASGAAQVVPELDIDTTGEKSVMMTPEGDDRYYDTPIAQIPLSWFLNDAIPNLNKTFPITMTITAGAPGMPDEITFGLDPSVSTSDDQQVTEFQVSGTKLYLTLEDGGGQQIVNLPPDNDTQLTEAEVDAFVSNNGYLDESTTFSGDVSGLYNNLQLGTNVVGLNEADESAINYWTKSGSDIQYNIGNASMSRGATNIFTLESTLSTGLALHQVRGSGGTFAASIAWGSSVTGTSFGIPRANSALFYSNSPLRIGTLGANPLYFGINGAIKGRFESDGDFWVSGNLGAGVNPTSKLHILGNASILDSRSSTILNGNASSGFYNVIVGNLAGANMTSTADYNLLLGRSAGTNITTGDANLAFAYQSLLRLTTGSNNIGIGASAGQWATTSSNSVYIGNGAGGTSDVSDRLFIGTALNSLIYGEFDNEHLEIQGDLEIYEELNMYTGFLGATSGETFTVAAWEEDGTKRKAVELDYGDNMFVSGTTLNSKFIDPYFGQFEEGLRTAGATELLLLFEENSDSGNNYTVPTSGTIRVDESGLYTYSINFKAVPTTDGDAFELKVKQEGTVIETRRFSGFDVGYHGSMQGYFVRSSTSNDDMTFTIQRFTTSSSTQLEDVTIMIERKNTSG